MFKVVIGPLTVQGIDGQKRKIGAAHTLNFPYHLKLEDDPTHLRVSKHYKAIPQCAGMIEAYRANVVAANPQAFDSNVRNVTNIRLRLSPSLAASPLLAASEGRVIVAAP